MSVICGDLLKLVENWLPLQLAEEWDNVGLLLGDAAARIEGVLIALDFNEAVLQEALKRKTNFIFVHHPVIFQPIKALNAADPQGQLLLTAARQHLNIYAAHTNLDRVAGGVSDQLAERLGLTEVDVLADAAYEEHFKLVVFVPETDAAAVQQAIGDAGAGFIGKYSHCAFRAAGMGYFLPQAGARPHMGQVGRVEQVQEFRLETIVPQGSLPGVIEAMLAAHPYEEVAYDLYPLANQGRPRAGLGRVGSLARPLSLEQLVELIKERLAVDTVKVVPGAARQISRVALCGGSGGSLIKQAVGQGAQVLVTGDVSYHQGQLAEGHGLTVIDAGHGPTENVVLPWLAEQIKACFKQLKAQTPVYLSQINTDPWSYY